MSIYTKYFPGFEQKRINTSDTTINTVSGGSGPPLLLLHGYPQNLLIWRKVAPALSKNFTVVATDLRGYGESAKPETDPQHYPYSKRVMAIDQVQVMQSLGFSNFYVVGHDRGARVAHRMSLDHPEKVKKVALLDILPTYQLYQETDMAFARNYWHWFFLIQPYPLPETLLANNTDFMTMAIFKDMLQKGQISDDILESYKRNFSDPTALRATCEDYRASAGIDLEHDEKDLQQKIKCPTFILWGKQNPVYAGKDMLNQWLNRASNVIGLGLDCGHFIPEEMPEKTVEIFNDYFKSD
jgi:haloacetate dehalogenase